MKALHVFRNYWCYCGIEKDEYNALKKDAYASNFIVWRMLHIVMTVIFGCLFIASVFSSTLSVNRVFYLIGFLYSAVALSLFFILDKYSIAAQLLIYLSISMLFLFSAFITENKPDSPATSFIAFLLITPMFMIDKPFFMTFELCAASTIFLVWMHNVKPYLIWKYDLINVVAFTVVGIFLHLIANSIRIREFVLTRKINIQKDTDELTGLKNKGALTREINAFLAEHSPDRGTLFIMDVYQFKAINDTYGHDVGDEVLSAVGRFLSGFCTGNTIAGRFGGDEFILFIRNEDDPETAEKLAGEIVRGVPEAFTLPDPERKIEVSVGAAICSGAETNYSEIFRKADTALYKAKNDPERKYFIFE